MIRPREKTFWLHWSRVASLSRDWAEEFGRAYVSGAQDMAFSHACINLIFVLGFGLLFAHVVRVRCFSYCHVMPQRLVGR